MKERGPTLAARRYLAALRRHLQQGPRAGSKPSSRTAHGTTALASKVLGLARIHQQALCALGAARRCDGIPRRATGFFGKAMGPILASHHAAHLHVAPAGKMHDTLRQRTRALAAITRQLRQGTVRRAIMQKDFLESRRRHKRSLKESLLLQKRLHQLTHRVLNAQESERTKISRELQNEIVQTLLGINLRLLSLKQEARHNTRNLRNEIASTQRSVVQSARSVRRVARKFGKL